MRPEVDEQRSGTTATLFVLSLAGVAYGLQNSMIYPSLPALQRDLHTTTAWTVWLATGFYLTSAVSTPIAGALGDRYGKVRVLQATLAIFALGSLGAGLAPDIWGLIAARSFQGIGACLIPLGPKLIAACICAHELLAQGVLSCPLVGDPSLGLIGTGNSVGKLRQGPISHGECGGRPFIGLVRTLFSPSRCTRWLSTSSIVG